MFAQFYNKLTGNQTNETNKTSTPGLLKNIIIMDCEANTGKTSDGVTIPKDKIDMIQVAALAVEQTDSDFVTKDSFSSFCRPGNFPILTEHIQNLTKIQQSQVDDAPSYHQVMHNFKTWRNQKGFTPSLPAFSGDWDMNNLLPFEQSRDTTKPMDSFFKGYINFKEAFKTLHPQNLSDSTPPEIIDNQGTNLGRLGTESLMSFYGIDKIKHSQDHQADWDVQHIFLIMQKMHQEGYRWTDKDIKPAKFMDGKYTKCKWDDE